MSNVIPFPIRAATGTVALPGGPFFCAQDGRYLPGLTDLVILAAAMVQRREIEEELFKIRLKQKCFLALAERAPQSIAAGVVQGEQLQPLQIARHVSAGEVSAKGLGSLQAPATIYGATESLPTLSAEEDNRFPKGRW